MNKISKMIGVILSLVILTSISFFSIQMTNAINDGQYYEYEKNRIAGESIENSEAPNISDLSYPTPYSGYNKALLIDVSYCQPSINWNQVYADGVKYVIIRVGGRGTQSGEIYYDGYFESHAKNAKAAGLKIGAYFFSAAINETEAKQEADWSINQIEAYGVKLDLPLFMDFEDTGTDAYGRVKQNIKNTGEGSNIINAFCRQARSRGYKSGVYSELDMLGNTGQSYGHWAEIWMLDQENYIWFANWNWNGLSQANYYDGLSVDIWQFGTGYVKGINGLVDVNVIFTKKPDKVSNIKISCNNLNNSTITVEASSNVTNAKYKIARFKDGKKIDTKTTTSPRYTYYDCEPGTYYFKICTVSEDLGIETESGWVQSKEYKAQPTVGTTVKLTSTPADGKTTSADKATLTWEKVSNARGYYVYERLNDKWEMIKDIRVTNTSTAKYSYKVDLKYGVNKFLVKAYNDDFKGHTVKSDYGRTVITREKEYYTYTFKTDNAYKKMKEIFTKISSSDVTATDSKKTLKVWDEVVKTKLTGTLDLSNSNLVDSDIEEIFKYTYPKVTTINLSKNKLTTTKNISGLPSLKSIDLSNNSLTEANNLYGVKNSLVTLNLKNNKLTSSGIVMLSQLTKVEYLYLDNNNIDSLPSSDLSKYKTITMKNQTINKVVNTEYCAYPAIFKEAMKANSKLASKLYYYGCENRTDGTAGIKITGTSNIYVSIQSGNAQGTKLNITLGDKVLTGISIGKLPNVTEYELNQKLDLTGGIIILKYAGGEETISMNDKDVTVAGFNSSTSGKKMVTLTYKGKTTSFVVTVYDNSLKSIEIQDMPDKTEYKVGESLNLAGGKILLKYNNGKESSLDMSASGVTVTGFDSTKEGKKELTVTYRGKTTKFNVTVNANNGGNDDNKTKTLVGIEVKAKPTKTEYVKNIDQLDLTGGKIAAKYSDNSEEIIDMTSNEVTVTGFDNKQYGENVLTVKYKRLTTTFTVNIVLKKLDKMTIKALPNKKIYIKNFEELDLEGGRISLIYNDGSEEILNMKSNELKVEGFDNKVAGTKQIKLTYEGKSVTFKVTVIEKEISQISIEAYPRKRQYIEMQELDLEGGKIKVIYSDESEDKFNMTEDGINVTGFDSTKVGTNTITVEYGGKTTTFDVTIIEDTDLPELEITGIPTFKTKENIILQINASDNGSGIESVTINGKEIEIQDGKGTYEIQENGKYVVIAKDKSGKEVREEIVINKIIKLGDINQNGKIDLNDLLKLIQHIATVRNGKAISSWYLDEESQELADVNQDGKINSRDLLKLKQYLAASKSKKIREEHPDWIEM